MDENIKIIASSQLFGGIPVQKVRDMTQCLGGVFRPFACGENIWHMGEKISQVGIVVSGKAYMESCDFWGNKSIITEYVVGDSFGEAYALSKDECPVFDVVAKEDTEIMFFDITRLKTVCDKNCPWHKLLIENLLATVATKARDLNFKMSHICKRTTREKLISYLSGESRKQHSSTFRIPFNRQELADYLSVERCAMSKELHKMKNDGLIDFSGNEFSLRMN